ncbi:MAG: class I SAM-dependent methyltransferase [Streptosporangiaceae bacterium]
MGTFAGDTAENYARYRRGYPDTVVAAVTGHLGLGPDDTVIDLGCGTGLLTAPAARNVGLVAGVDPEAGMLAIARRQAGPGLSSKVVWVLGSDDDLPAVARLLGDGSAGAVTVGQALHFMDYENLFVRARRLLRPGGGIAVIANGVPLWQQDSQWSHSLRMALDAWFGTTTTATCGNDRATQARYANALSAAGYDVHEVAEEYQADLMLEEVLGGLHSAMSPGGRALRPS